jgi:hypothetical protein
MEIKYCSAISGLVIAVGYNTVDSGFVNRQNCAAQKSLELRLSAIQLVKNATDATIHQHVAKKIRRNSQTVHVFIMV